MRSGFRVSEFSVRLKERRSVCGYTQVELAKKIGVTTRALQAWERDENKGCDSISVKNAISLCGVLECDFDYLFGKQDLPTKEASDVQAVTGLSGKAIEYLSGMRRNAQNFVSWRLDDDKDRTLLVNMFQQEIDVVSALLEDAQSCSPDAPSTLPNIFSYVLRSLQVPDSGYFEIVDGNENVGTFTREDLEDASLYTGVMLAVKRFKQQFTAEERARTAPHRSEEVSSGGSD